jgi:hypothetical protein
MNKSISSKWGLKSKIQGAEMAKRQKSAFLCCFWAYFGVFIP